MQLPSMAGFGAVSFFRACQSCLVSVSSAVRPPTSRGPRDFSGQPPPAEPKIEYQTFYFTDHDIIHRGNSSWVTEVMLGKAQPRRIFQRPFDVVSDGKGMVFISDLEYGKVIILDLEEHEIRTMQGSKGGEYLINSPTGLAVNREGKIFVAASGQGRILLFDDDERFAKEFGGEEELQQPVGLAVDDGRNRVYVADAKGHQIVVYDQQGKFLQRFGSRGEGPGAFNYPLDVDLDSEGNLYVLDSMNARVQVFDPDGNFLRAFGERGTAAGSFRIAKALAVDGYGHVYVTDSAAHRFIIFDLMGNYLLSVGGKETASSGITPGGFYLPEGIDVDPQGGVWVADSLNRVLHRFQYLSESYLEQHPILPGQAYQPPGKKTTTTE